jgi:hypothetical protein
VAKAWKDMHSNLFQWSNLGDQNWVFGVINFEIQLLPNIYWFWVGFFFHMVQYVVYYNFHVYKFGFYSHKNMLWLFEWKQWPRVLGFVGHCIRVAQRRWKILNSKLVHMFMQYIKSINDNVLESHTVYTKT